MTEAVLEALGAQGGGEGATEPAVILRPEAEESPGEEPVILSEAEDGSQAQSLSFRASAHTGVGIRPPEAVGDAQSPEPPLPGGERIATPVTRSLVRNDRPDGADTQFSPRGGDGVDRVSSADAGNGQERVSSDADLRAHFDSLCAQAAALREDFPDFDLAAALRDPAFLRLTSPALGVGAREAWGALHPEQLSQRAARRAAQEARELLARAAAQGARRPREGGGFDAAALTRSDYRSLPRGERERLKERIREAAARGERVFP